MIQEFGKGLVTIKPGFFRISNFNIMTLSPKIQIFCVKKTHNFIFPIFSRSDINEILQKYYI